MANVFGLDLSELESVFYDGSTKQDAPTTTKRKTISDVDIENIKKVKLTEVPLEFDPTNITIHKVEIVEGCQHEIALPSDMVYTPLVKSNKPPVKTYKFELDSFQKEAVRCIEHNQSVLVSAHTSAGKTVVAEYAIATSLRNKQRVIYTTPIKALSNQKFREFTEEFASGNKTDDVGLMTGDVTINPNAGILIMTTEILRSMLYRGSDIMREVGWVVFDEIHYMRDKIRGVVWEEAIIMLPHVVRYVFLSATIPNASQFAAWVAALHKQPCHVVYTDYRPVPLQHYVFPCGGDGIHLVVDEKGEFREENFDKAMAVLRTGGEKAKSDMNRRGRQGGFRDPQTQTNCFKLIDLVMKGNLEPLIVFSFSKKECEAYAMQLTKMDFTSDNEKAAIELIFRNAMNTLSEEDQKLPQVRAMLPVLKKGIGVHHGGLMPLLKEVVEILFGEGYIKCLFATETFAMGLNMPARTVLFTAARKFDGKDFRYVSSGEYIQMSGRAGRRGKDTKGTVILMLDQTISPTVSKTMVQGQADALNSAFHLTYNTVLNLLRVEEVNPEFMMQRSFFQFQNSASVPELLSKLAALEKIYKTMDVPDEESVREYRLIVNCIKLLEEEKWAVIRRPRNLVPYLQRGRLAKMRRNDDDFGWCVVLKAKKRANQQKVPAAQLAFDVEVLCRVSRESSRLGHSSLLAPASLGSAWEGDIIVVGLEGIYELSTVVVKVPESLGPRASRQGTLEAIGTVREKLKGEIPHLDPVKDMKIRDSELEDTQKKMDHFNQRLKKHKLLDDPGLNAALDTFTLKEQKKAEIEQIEREIAQKQSLLQLDELKARKRILRRLGFCSEDDVITLKGRVACEISSADELLLTELLLDGVFNDLSAGQTASLLSCFVFEEKTDDEGPTVDDLNEPYRLLQEKARYIARVSHESRLEIDEEAYVESFRPGLMGVVSAWAGGASFARICDMTGVFEGSIIRTMRRLEELLRQMHSAARAIGYTDLENKFAEGMVLIKRDIIFAASLYL